MKKNITNSALLKILCYTLIPIFVALIILSAIYTEYVSVNSDIFAKNNFYETDIFASNYESRIDTILIYLKNSIRPPYTKVENIEDEIYCYYNHYNTNSEMINYLIVDDKTNKAYTNIDITEKTDSIEKLKSFITNEQNKYWNYDGNEVNTNIENEKLKNIKYSYLYDELKNEKYDIYTCLNDNGFSIFCGNNIFNLAKKLRWFPTIIIPILLVITIGMFIYLCISIGHKKGYDGIYLNRLDRWPIEITGVISIFLIAMIFGIMTESDYNIYNTLRMIFLISLFVIGYFAIYAIFAIIVTILLKKIKTSTLWKSSILYKILNSTYKLCKKIYETITSNLELNAKIIACIIGVILISIILLNMGGFGALVLLVFWCYILYKIFKKVNEFKIIKNTAKQIYNGNVDEKIDETLVKGEFKELSTYINDIAGGFSNAIEESLKSERLKTELITNVSHDIKTPLTSIINYVDLLKKEDIQDEKAKGYIQILDNKSQRLKKLTEDLIEASKVSSGNVKLNIEKINVGELIKQSIAEFEDKFKEKSLQIITDLPNTEININADSRYMYRAIENIYSNISKYSLENSRVYIDVKIKEEQVYMSFKNISKERLNITADELMERFVRGDKSRTTEGSGLGISISKSLVELQNGKFNLQVDGDLFKVELIFQQYKN